MADSMTQGTAAVKGTDRYTYKEYKTFPEDQRWELIDGEAWDMSPSPRRTHQQILIQFAGQLDKFFSGKLCRPHIAPVDVFLPNSTSETSTSQKPSDPSIQLESTTTIVQPDAFVVCDPTKLTDLGVTGAPDFVIEILSPTTALKDQTEKRLLYETHGVKEYWVVNPITYEVFIYTLKEHGSYGIPVPADLRQPVPVSIFTGLELKVRPEDL
jgi:Uma2 family endonuclease